MEPGIGELALSGWTDAAIDGWRRQPEADKGGSGGAGEGAGASRSSAGASRSSAGASRSSAGTRGRSAGTTRSGAGARGKRTAARLAPLVRAGHRRGWIGRAPVIGDLLPGVRSCVPITSPLIWARTALAAINSSSIMEASISLSFTARLPWPACPVRRNGKSECDD